jgi:hypothetical protein
MSMGISPARAEAAVSVMAMNEHAKLRMAFIRRSSKVQAGLYFTSIQRSIPS